MNYNRETRKWNALDESFDTQMQAWLTVKESGKICNEDYQFPDFPSQEELRLDTYVDRMKDLLNKINLGLTELLKRENKTYDSFIYSYDSLMEELSDFFYPLSHLKSVKDNKELRDVYSACLPLLSEFYSNLGQNEELFEAFNEIKQKEEDPVRNKVLDEALLSFKLSGIGQDEFTKNKIKQISARLSDLSDQFSNNVLEATNSFKKIVEEADVEGMPEDLKERAKTEDGKYQFSLHYPSYSAYMDYGPNQQIREELYKAYTTKASEENENIIEEILALKHEKAVLLGYENYAQISLEPKMVDSVDKVLEFLTSLGHKSKPMGDLELKELNDFAGEEIEVYDSSFYTNKLLKENYNFDEEEYKPYFELDNTVNGLFSVLYKMFGLVFKKVDEAKTWDPRVTVYDVYKNDMRMSRVYMDLENRNDKRPGAWMNEWHSRHVNENNEVRLPIAFIVANFTPAMANKPSLLTPREVVTLFHEMGHVLQHICYEGNELSCSGINGIEWDAVEWSSQFLESFVYDKQVLNMFAKHYETGEVLPDDMVDKMVENKNFHSAWGMLGQTIYGLFDMKIHSSTEPMTANQVQETLNEIRSEYSLLETPDYNKFQCGFSHIFAGGYSAGYYSYKWAEVLSSDCHLKFLHEGVFNQELCESYYNNFLCRGSEMPSMDMFKNFMGREPNEDSLLEYLGIK
jgi:oligopeptidase A